MSDITMCRGKNNLGECRKENFCYRFTATPDKYAQSYFVTAPFKFTKNLEFPYDTVTDCTYFWSNKNE